MDKILTHNLLKEEMKNYFVYIHIFRGKNKIIGVTVGSMCILSTFFYAHAHMKSYEWSTTRKAI